MTAFSRADGASLGLSLAPLLCREDTSYRAFHRVVKMIMAHLPDYVDQISIFSVNRGGDTLQEEAIAGLFDGQGMDRIPVYHLPRELVEEGRPLIRTHGKRHEIFAPIHLGGTLTGMLSILCRRFPSDEQLEALNALASVLAPAVAYLLRGRKDEPTLRLLHAATRMGRDLVSMRGLTTDNLLYQFVSEIVSQLGFDRALLVIFSPDGPSPVRGIGATVGHEPMEVGPEHVPSIPSLQTAPIELTDIPGLWVPIHRGSQRFGALLVDNIWSMERMAEESIQVLLDLSAQLALVLENTRLMESLHSMAIRDDLTGLYRPGYFYERIQEELCRADREKRSAALFFIDLNKFKKVNDTFGHQVGDAVLVHMARSLRSVMRASDVLCRMGGDEFLVLVARMRRDEAVGLAERVKERIAADVYTTPDGNQIHLSASVGFAMYPDDATEWQALIHSANQAMFAAKRHSETVGESVIFTKDPTSESSAEDFT